MRITGQRPDGYHELQTVFQLLEWGDSVRLRVRSDSQIHNPASAVYGVEAGQDITVRAAAALQEAAGNVPQGVATLDHVAVRVVRPQLRGGTEGGHRQQRGRQQGA